MADKRPRSGRNLDIALERLVGKENIIRKRAVVANAIVAQMLPNGSAKGVSTIKMRWATALRALPRISTSRASAFEEFSERLASALGAGWEGFTGPLVEARHTSINYPTAALPQ